MAFLKSSVPLIDSSKCSAQCFETLDPAWPSKTAKKLHSFIPIDPRLGRALKIWGKRRGLVNIHRAKAVSNYETSLPFSSPDS